MALWQTPDEVIDTMTALDGPARTVTYKQLRYWDDSHVVPASRRAGVESKHATRLYGADDVAMLRLAVLVLASGRSLRQVSEALRYRGAEIRAAFRSSRPLALTFTARGVAEVVPVYAVAAGVDAYPVADCFAGVVEAMRAHRRDKPRVWSGFRFELPSALEVAAA